MTIHLSHTDKEKVHNDIKKLLPEWTEETKSPQGHISFYKLAPRTLEPAVEDDDGNIITPAVTSNETRYDINIHPLWSGEIPEFETQVTPNQPEHKFA